MVAGAFVVKSAGYLEPKEHRFEDVLPAVPVVVLFGDGRRRTASSLSLATA
jgi:hypothetical protein